MKDYSSLTDSVQVPIDDDVPISVTEQAVPVKETPGSQYLSCWWP